jgi:hypothetical protein
MLLIFTAAASAQKGRFVGTFVNEDPDTGGITRLVLYEDDTVNVWGRCHPTDCNWGEETAFAYGSHVAADLRTTADAMSATYVKGFATKILLITPLKGDRIRVDVFTRFTDRSRRTAFAVSYVLVREGTPQQP